MSSFDNQIHSDELAGADGYDELREFQAAMAELDEAIAECDPPCVCGPRLSSLKAAKTFMEDSGALPICGVCGVALTDVEDIVDGECAECQESAEWIEDEDDYFTDAEADADTFRSCGWGTDEDYGYYGEGEEW